jgi:hypothetical protein
LKKEITCDKEIIGRINITLTKVLCKTLLIIKEKEREKKRKREKKEKRDVHHSRLCSKGHKKKKTGSSNTLL